MSDPSSSPFSSGAPSSEVTLETLAQSYQSLRMAFNVSLVLVGVLSASLSIFFIRELSIARRQTNELNSSIAEYERTAVPLLEDFRTKLQAFTASHPDFAPIYAKYFGGTNVPSGNPIPNRAQPASNAAGVRLPPGR